MAIIHFINRPKSQTVSGMNGVLNYTMQEKKTVYDNCKYVSGINCSPDTSLTEFRNTKRLYGKEDGRQYYHFVQSFPVGEIITPDTAHEIALRFVNECEKLKGFEIIVSTHSDRDHIHSHFIMNSVNAESGKKFHISQRDIEEMMHKSDSIIDEYGLSVLEPASTRKTKQPTDREFRIAVKGESWKLQLALAIDDAMTHAVSKEHFIELMSLEGYTVRWTDERKYITYTTPDGNKCRDIKLHEDKYVKESMENEFRLREKIFSVEGKNQTADADCRESSADRNHNRHQLEGTDGGDSYPNRNAEQDCGTTGVSNDHAGTFESKGQPSGLAYSVHRGQLSGNGGFSARDNEIYQSAETSSRRFDEGNYETGWENERELLAESFYAGEQDCGCDRTAYESNVLDIADTFGSAYSIGTDAAYLIGDLGNIIDENAPIEDCTTIKPPRKQKKNTGPVMGGM